MKSSALLLLLVASLNAGAQQTPPADRTGRITGTVTDRTSGKGLGDVRVRIAGTGYGMQTRANGQYVIIGLPAGTYTLVAEGAGYAPTEVSGVTVSLDATLQVDVAMRLVDKVAASAAERRSAPIVEQGTLGRPPEDPISRCLVPPEVIMAHQGELNLEDAQRTKLIAEMSKAQAKFTEVQWTMGSEQQKLEQLLAKPAIDEAAALKQLERIMSIEQDLKRTQMTLLIRVKNTLTPVQLKTIADLLGQGQRGYGRCGA